MIHNKTTSGAQTNAAAAAVVAAPVPTSTTRGNHHQQHATTAAAVNNASSLTRSSVISSSMVSSSVLSMKKKHEKRQDRLRRKTIKTLNEYFYSNNIMETKRQEARLAGQDTVNRIMYRVSNIQTTTSSRHNGNGVVVAHQHHFLSATAAAAVTCDGGSGSVIDHDFYSVASSSSSISNQSSFLPLGSANNSMMSANSSEQRAIRRGRRRGLREANEINSNNNNNKATFFGGRKRNKPGGGQQQQQQQHPSTSPTSSSLLANGGSRNTNSYISPFDLTTIAEHQQPYPQQPATVVGATTVVSDNGIISSRQHSRNSSRASSGASSRRSWFGGVSGKSKNNKPVVSAKQAAAMVAGWPTKGKYHLPQVLQVDQEPHERRDFYDTLGIKSGVAATATAAGGLLFLGGGNNNSNDNSGDGQHVDGGGRGGANSISSTGGKNGGGSGGGGGEDAWMCGVCGKAYVTYEAAERHEQLHIEKVVDQLGFCAVRTNNNTKKNRRTSGPSATMSFNSQRCSTQQQQQQQPIAAPLTASNVAAATVNQVGNASTTINGRASTEFKSARQTETEQAPIHNNSNVDDSARGISNNGIANQRRGQERVELQRGNGGDDENYDSEQDKKSADASTRNDLYRNYIRDSFGGVNHHPDGLLVPRSRGGEAAFAGTPLPSSMKQQGSQHKQQIQQPGRQNRLSEVRFENSERSLPLLDGPLSTIDGSQRRYNVNNIENNTTGDDFQDDAQTEQQALVLSSAMQDYASLADEALVTVCEKARPLILTMQEWQAELELSYLANDKLYYDQMAQRALARIVHPYSSRLRSEGEDIMAQIQNKFVDAYQLCKEGDNKKGFSDQYRKKHKDGNTNVMAIEHTSNTLYLNVMVKNSIQVVRHELERLARERWERDAEIEKYSRFERFRVYAHVNIVRLAGIALASDFTPRRIAVQLSNDLYRLLTPRLKRRGVTISTEIEYRVGPYFVLAVNINTILWQKLIKSTYRDVAARKAKWVAERQPLSPEEEEEEAKKNRFVRMMDYLRQMCSLTRYEILAQFFAWFYQLHWIIYQPICILWYYTFLGPTIRHFIISSVADEIFYYVEEKGMEMEIEIRQASTQAAFMLSALREIRADGQELKKKRQQSELHERGVVLGPLLGPAIKADKNLAVEPPGFELPANLEFIGLELDLPVGFRRLRWALLSNSSTFVTEALWRTEAKYDNITTEPWNKHDEYIGVPSLAETVKEEDFVGAEKVASYLMPKSAFVGANMCTETSYILAYNEYCFCVKKKASTPGVPYGSTFLAWTQLLVVNTGNDTCKLSCSVEPEFPNGPPMVSRQITSGMRAGVGELFVKIGETITKYADEYP